ncbi:MAG: type III-A CRISPR-associated protein Cas10/Csm1 [Magnetococcales bacterium]|nr:type III-A CRISPR-associated protein Cas10/Csm1 [Magnetococcales bacterium]
MDKHNRNLLHASCRMALAGFIHDVGKFAERAGIEANNLDGNKSIYCPTWQGGRQTHIHAAYTGIAIDAIEAFMPDLKKDSIEPFSSWRDSREQQRVGDSLINTAAMHHKPETPLQRIIATADRLASGFERSTFEAYNQAEEEHEGVRQERINHRQARLWPLLEQITLQKGETKLRTPSQRYPLRPLAPTTLFPDANGTAASPPMDRAQAQAEYKQLWEQFVEGVEKIPPAHRDFLDLWLDDFDTLLLTFTHAIPSATAAKKPGGGFIQIPSDVALYDHLKATAAFAVALWRYHLARGSVESAFSESGWKEQWDTSREQEFLLIQGDFSGIQEFIFAEGGETTKKAAKLLRGRSFQVSLLTELAAVAVLAAFELPPTSQIVNAAGKFLIVAPNLDDAGARLDRVRDTFDRWFLEHTFGQGSISLATTPATRADFRKGAFDQLIRRLFQDLEVRKRQRFDLCGAQPPESIFPLPARFRACTKCGQRNAAGRDDGTCRLCADQITIGENLVKKDRLRITRTGSDNRPPGVTLAIDYFGYQVSFLDGEKDKEELDRCAGQAVRIWDFSLPDAGDAPLWHGYARRSVNGYLWKVQDEKGEEKIADFEEIAKQGVKPDAKGEPRGVAALAILKGDVDNLGQIFQSGLGKRNTFARMATLSRQMHAFFAIWLPWHCREKAKNTYTVFAGGDDFFLIGPWLEQMHLAAAMHEAFARYVAGNPDIHFSAGLVMTKPDLPIPTLATRAEEALAEAKQYRAPPTGKPPAADPQGKKECPAGVATKNAVTCWQRSVGWARFKEMLAAEKELAQLVEAMQTEHELEVSTGYLYDLLHLCEKAEIATKKPEDAIWHAWFVYRTWRFVVDRLKKADDAARHEVSGQFAEKIGERIRSYKEDYKIALFTHLYQRRKSR